jgi:hypothetical protein
MLKKSNVISTRWKTTEFVLCLFIEFTVNIRSAHRCRGLQTDSVRLEEFLKDKSRQPDRLIGETNFLIIPRCWVIAGRLGRFNTLQPSVTGLLAAVSDLRKAPMKMPHSDEATESPENVTVIS